MNELPPKVTEAMQTEDTNRLRELGQHGARVAKKHHVEHEGQEKIKQEQDNLVREYILEKGIQDEQTQTDFAIYENNEEGEVENASNLTDEEKIAFLSRRLEAALVVAGHKTPEYIKDYKPKNVADEKLRLRNGLQKIREIKEKLK